MEEVNCFTWEEVCHRWQSQPVDVEQWDEMSKEMQDALEQENKNKDALENEAKMLETNPSKHAEWEKSLEDIPEEQDTVGLSRELTKCPYVEWKNMDMETLSRELAKCPCPWEHMDAYKVLMENKPDDNTAVEQCKTNENNAEFHDFDEEMTRHYDEWFKKAVLFDSYLSADNTVTEQSRTNENNEEFRVMKLKRSRNMKIGLRQKTLK